MIKVCHVLERRVHEMLKVQQARTRLNFGTVAVVTLTDQRKYVTCPFSKTRRESVDHNTSQSVQIGVK